MIGTEFIKGQGLGNQLFCYVTARAIATDRGLDFGCANQGQFANNIHSNQGMYFMDIDLGHVITPAEQQDFKRYEEAEVRLYLGNSAHDMEHGCYVGGADPQLAQVADRTLLYGNMQDESYFSKYLPQLKQWLKVKPEYDSYEYSRENLCIINMRGGEYTGSPELFIDRSYWLKGMKHMKAIRSDMEFMIITDDVEAAGKVLPEVPAYHFDMGKDFVTIKNAYYLLLSNSSFACLAAFINEKAKYLIAPKYWARYNVSDGYWASEQNIYSIFHYQDRKGRLFTPAQCLEELAAYKKRSGKYQRRSRKPGKLGHLGQWLTSKYIKGLYLGKRIVRRIFRRSPLRQA